jgi:hypothetical protein
MFRAAIRIIDYDKRAALNQQLLQSISSNAHNEKQEEKPTTLDFRRGSVHIDCKDQLSTESDT